MGGRLVMWIDASDASPRFAMDAVEAAVGMEPADTKPAPMDAAPGSPKEGLTMTATSMTATNAMGGTFGLGLDQYELPKASIAKVARSEVRALSYLDPRLCAAPQGHTYGACQVGVRVRELPQYVAVLTAAAASHDVAIARGNKTISAAHVMDAMRELDFPVSMRKELREQLQGTSVGSPSLSRPAEETSGGAGRGKRAES